MNLHEKLRSIAKRIKKYYPEHAVCVSTDVWIHTGIERIKRSYKIAVVGNVDCLFHETVNTIPKLNKLVDSIINKSGRNNA